MNIYPVKIQTITDQARLFTGVGSTGDYQDRTFIQQSGFTSHPPAKAFGIVLVEDNACYLIATSDDDKPSVPNERDTAIYANKENYIMVKASGDIEIKNRDSSIKMIWDDVNKKTHVKIDCTGDIELGYGNLKKLITEDLITLYNAHVHYFPATSTAAATSVPTVPLTVAVATTKVAGK